MLRHVKYIPFLLFFFTSLSAQVIKNFNVTGNRVFDDDNYYTWSGINTGQKLAPGLLDTIKINIAAELGKRGYLQSRFDSTSADLSPDSEDVTYKHCCN